MKFTVFVLSDGSGRTAQQALNAALTQFPGIETEVRVRAEVRSKAQVQQIIAEVLRENGFILHTIVKDDIRNEIIRSGRINNIETIDLMGPLLSRLGHHFENTPSQKPGLFHKINKEYFRRIDAMQFAFTHDDGARINELDNAEIILLGVSRTFKTPLSIYLAFKGWFVANIPIIAGIKPPQELYSVPPGKVFCLTTSVRRLAALRQVREEYLGGLTGEYASLDYVKKELSYAESFFKTVPEWPIIKVTGKPIEEITSEILAIKGKK